MENKKMEWSDLFNPNNKLTKGFDLNALIQATPKQDEILQHGANSLLKKIQIFQEIMESNRLPQQMRKDLESTCLALKTIAEEDVKKLVLFLNNSLRTSLTHYDNKIKNILNEKIVKELDKLIIKQAILLRKKTKMRVKISTSKILKKEFLLDSYNIAKETINREIINKQDYIQGISALLILNLPLTPHQAEKLYAFAQTASNPHQSLEEFLKILKIILFSQEPFEEISNLKNNTLLKNLDMEQILLIHSANLSIFLETANWIASNLWEENLKNNYNNIILKNIDSLTNIVEQEISQENLQHIRALLLNG